MPLSRHEAFRIQALQIMDALLVWGSFLLAWSLREIVRNSLGMTVAEEDVRESIHWVLYIAVPFTPLVLERFGFYRQPRSKSPGRSFSQIIQGLIVIALILGMFAIFAKFTDVRRLALGFGFLLVAITLFTRDRITTLYLRNKTTREDAKEPVLFAGSKSETKGLLEELDPDITEGWRVCGHFDLETQPVSELYDLIRETSVSRVIFATKEVGFDKVSQAVEACELQGVEAWIAATFMRSQVARPTFDAIGEKPMLVLRSTPELSWELLIKGVFDRIAASLMILGTLPLWIFAALMIKIQSPGAPILFTQRRSGRYGKPFTMWKFRTMVPDADKVLDDIKKEHGNHMDGPVFKLNDDPRIIPIGRFLRKFSIDELPQLINVVRGEMSLVGPRPLPTYEIEAISEIAHRRRLSVKPGVTCEWQVAGRNHITDFEQWVKMDLQYIDNWSLWLDFTILLRTIPAVLFGRGAK